MRRAICYGPWGGEQKRKISHNHLELRLPGLDGRALGHGGALGVLLLGAFQLGVGEVVDGGELNERREDEGEADGDEPVHGGGVGHLGQRVACADAQGGHGEDGGDA